MVRKVSIMVAILLLCFGFAVTAQAATYSPYEGNPSNTYITYFRDIVSGIGFNDNYVAFRSGQNEYIMVVGDLDYNNGQIVLNSEGSLYTMATDGNYNGYYRYSVDSITDFTLNTEDKIIYSDVGQFPQLVERGAKYEILTTLLLSIALLGLVISGIFRHS